MLLTDPMGPVAMEVVVLGQSVKAVKRVGSPVAELENIVVAIPYITQILVVMNHVYNTRWNHVRWNGEHVGR